MRVRVRMSLKCRIHIMPFRACRMSLIVSFKRLIYKTKC
jgi:hypothetical protein